MRDLQTATPHPSPSATITNCTGRGHAAEKHPLNLIRLAPAEGMQTVIPSTHTD